MNTLASKMTPEEYAQKRANETGSKYAVFYSLSHGYKYAALYCGFNRKAYKAIGADLVSIFKCANAAS
jgi:hypothetical protein